jgi:hypothetical protein
MLYEDFQRPDITVDFEATDQVLARRNAKNERIELAGSTDRVLLCLITEMSARPQHDKPQGKLLLPAEDTQLTRGYNNR